MSDYTFKARHRKSGKEYEGVALDNYFGRHQYGYQVKNFGNTMRQEIFTERFLILEDNLAEQEEQKQDDPRERTFMLTDGCMWEQNKKQGTFHPHAIEVVDTETGQVRYIESGAKIKFVDGRISDSRDQESYNKIT